jgi:hypothetical protein
MWNMLMHVYPGVRFAAFNVTGNGGKTMSETAGPTTFESIFFRGSEAVSLKVPDYQRAYSWEQKQIDLFIRDLAKYGGKENGGDYYFGHFIVEKSSDVWEIVDGQQRITTFVLFLLVCCALGSSNNIPAAYDAYDLINQFSPVGYDVKAFSKLRENKDLRGSLKELAKKRTNPEKPPSDDDIVGALGLPKDGFTLSQRRMVLALLDFFHAFTDEKQAEKGLKVCDIDGYVKTIMAAQCSVHLAESKSVAVNIFDMQNTRGVPLTTLEIIKAKLMKFVYDNGGGERDKKVAQIQCAFGKIYRMEESVAAASFRGEMTMEQLLRSHLRAVDDGGKRSADDFRSPAINANSDALVEYVDSKLRYDDERKAKPRAPAEGVAYAINLAREFEKSVRIIAEVLPKGDSEEPLVGDVMILERGLSCEFFLIVCRGLEQERGRANGRVGGDTLVLWERLLFTRDFHDKYYNLNRDRRDNFPALFQACVKCKNDGEIWGVVKKYEENGFRPQRTKGLQSIVRDFLANNENNILRSAFHWQPWRKKVEYAIYKYEKYNRADLRCVMKGTISVEHILPLEWDERWAQKIRDFDGGKFKAFRESIDSCINGIGNLLLLTTAENASAGNGRPEEKNTASQAGPTTPPAARIGRTRKSGKS